MSVRKEKGYSIHRTFPGPKWLIMNATTGATVGKYNTDEEVEAALEGLPDVVPVVVEKEHVGWSTIAQVDLPPPKTCPNCWQVDCISLDEVIPLILCAVRTCHQAAGGYLARGQANGCRGVCADHYTEGRQWGDLSNEALEHTQEHSAEEMEKITEVWQMGMSRKISLKPASMIRVNPPKVVVDSYYLARLKLAPGLVVRLVNQAEYVIQDKDGHVVAGPWHDPVELVEAFAE